MATSGVDEGERADIAAAGVTYVFDDVWSRADALCAYCAHTLAYDQNRCSRCGRNLLVKRYRYPRPGTNLHLLWVLLFGLGQIYLLWVIYDVVVERNILAAAAHVFLMGVFFGLAAGVYFRQSWAHLSAILILCAIFLVAVINFLVPVDLTALGLAQLDPALGGFLGALTGSLARFLKSFELVAIVLALFVAVILAGPDFDRVETRQVAAVIKGLESAGDYHVTAGKLAQAGLWASAILHWQRAAAKEPYQVIYQRHLGQAYARLGFYERSLDVLQSASRRASQPAMRAELQQLIHQVEQQRDVV